jgi:hypothetical protein
MYTDHDIGYKKNYAFVGRALSKLHENAPGPGLESQNSVIFYFTSIPLALIVSK